MSPALLTQGFAWPTAGLMYSRPMTATTYTLELADKFCAAIADGKTIRAVCKLDGMPSKATIFRWLREHPEFAVAYGLATDERADTLIDEIVEIADNCRVDADDPQSQAPDPRPRRAGAEDETEEVRQTASQQAVPELLSRTLINSDAVLTYVSVIKKYTTIAS